MSFILQADLVEVENQSACSSGYGIIGAQGVGVRDTTALVCHSFLVISQLVAAFGLANDIEGVLRVENFSAAAAHRRNAGCNVGCKSVCALRTVVADLRVREELPTPAEGDKAQEKALELELPDKGHYSPRAVWAWVGEVRKTANNYIPQLGLV